MYRRRYFINNDLLNLLSFNIDTLCRNLIAEEIRVVWEKNFIDIRFIRKSHRR